jgi:hypothetical protein
MTLKEYCIQYHTYGINAVPTVINHKDIRRNKVPFGLTVKTWHEYLAQEWTDFDLFANPFFNGIGIVCGKISGNIEVIDIDSKYQEHRNLFGDMQEMICNIEPELWDSLVIEKTVSGGYHLIYRCAEIGGNEKLANRLPNEADIEKAKAEGKKAPKQIGLIETRGMGGFCVTAPTPGYELIQGSFEHIPVISEIQREMLFDAAISLNEIVTPEHVPVAPQKQPQRQIDNTEDTGDDIPCWTDYNNQKTCLDLLSVAGWKEVSRDSKRIKMCHPAQKTRKPTAFIDLTYNFLGVFSTNTEFDTYNKYGGKGNTNAYTPFKIYAEWNHRGDYKAAAKDLYAQGYGTRKKPAPAPVAEKKTFAHKVIKSEVNAEKKVSKTKLNFSEEIQNAETILLHQNSDSHIFETLGLKNAVACETSDFVWDMVSTLGLSKRYIICLSDKTVSFLVELAKGLAAANVMAEVFGGLEKHDDMNFETGDFTINNQYIAANCKKLSAYIIDNTFNSIEYIAEIYCEFPSIAKITGLIAELPKKPEGLKAFCKEQLKVRKEKEKARIAAEAEENSVLVEDGITWAKNATGTLLEVCKGELSIPYQLPSEIENECDWIICLREIDEISEKENRTYLRVSNDNIGSEAGLQKAFRAARKHLKVSKLQITHLNNTLIPQSKIAEKNDTLGWHKDSAMWFFHNEAFDYKEKAFRTPNEISIIEMPEGAIYLPHNDNTRKAKKDDENFITSFKYRKSDIIMHDIAKFYKKHWGDTGVLVLMWGVASAYVDFISRKANSAAPFFPLLYCQGQKGSGKTTMIEIFRFFYTKEIETVSLRSPNNTAAALQSTFCKYSGIPILMDDYGTESKSTELATGTGVSAFNRRTELKRDISNLAVVKNPAISATLAYTSNVYPKDDTGAFQDRLFHFKIDTTQHTADEEAALKQGLNLFESQGLCTSFIYEVIGNRDVIEKEFDAEYSNLQRWFKATTQDYEIGSRQIAIYSMITAVGLILSRAGVSFFLNENQIKEAARSAIIRQHNTLQAQTPLQVFWEIIKIGYEQGFLHLGEHFDYQANGYKARNNAAKVIQGEVIIINYPALFNYYTKEAYKMGLKVDKDTKKDLKDEIIRSPAYDSTEIDGVHISELKSWRFSVAAELQQEKGKESTTVAYILKLAELEKNYGFYIKK